MILFFFVFVVPVMLDECIGFLEDNVRCNGLSYEIIVVSDGSKDKTVEVAQKYISKLGSEKMRVLDLITNRGKGGAVRLVCFQFFDFIKFLSCLLIGHSEY